MPENMVFLLIFIGKLPCSKVVMSQHHGLTQKQ